MRKNHYFVVVVLLFVLLSGCLAGYPGLHGDQFWSLQVWEVEEDQSNGDVELHVDVGVGGKPSDDLQIKNVRVCVIDETNEVISKAHLGTFTSNHYSVNVTLTAPDEPTAIVFGYDSIESENEYYIRGAKRGEDGVYRSLDQEESQCRG